MGRSKSKFWKHFKKLNNETAACQYCDKVVKTSRNTSNMGSHLSYSHPTVLTSPKNKNEIIESSQAQSVGPPSKRKKLNDSSEAQPSTSSRSFANSSQETKIQKSKNKNDANLKSYFNSAKSFESGGKNYKKLTEKILYMVCKDSQALNIVEREGFTELIKHLAPHYSIPCRKTFGKYLDEKYDEISVKYKELIRTIINITLTTDLWTDSLNNRSFLGITAHYLVGSEMESIMLGVHEFPGSHTSDNIKEKLSDILFDWGIPLDNVSAIVTDNAANIVKAAKDLFGENRHVGCNAHKINLIVQNSLSRVPSLNMSLSKVKSIVTFVKKSNLASNALREKSNLKLKQDVPTRWNSTYYMLKRFIELRRVVAEILLDYVASPPMVTPSEIEELSEVCKLLEPFEEITREWSAEKLVTVSKIIPSINGTIEQLQKMPLTRNAALELRNKLLLEIAKQYPSIEKNRIFSISTLLDPRFKKLDFTDSSACTNAINNIKHLLNYQVDRRSSGVNEDLNENIPGKSFNIIYKK